MQDITSRCILIGGQRSDSLFAVGALNMPDLDEACTLARKIEDIRQESSVHGRLLWNLITSQNRDEYRRLMRTFMETESLRVSIVVASADEFSPEGRCVQIYRMYWEALCGWLEPGSIFTLQLPADFDSFPCGGKSCHFSYVGGSSCPSTRGRVPVETEAHLRSADLSAVIERSMSPRTNLETDSIHHETEPLLDLIDVLLGAAVYGREGEKGSVAKLELCEMFESVRKGRRANVMKLRDGRVIPRRKPRTGQSSSEIFNPDDLPEGEKV